MSMFEAKVFDCDAVDEARGATEAQRAECPYRNVYNGGVAGMFEKLTAIREKVHEDAPDEHKVEAAEEKLFEVEKKKFGTEEAEQRYSARFFRQRQGFKIIAGEAPWQGLTGINPRNEHLINPNRRAKQLRDFLTGVDKMLRFEFANAARDGQERTKFWDPLRMVCVQLGISQRRLSAYAKEILGISASEMVDRIQAESVRGKMKEELKKFVAEFFSRKDAKAQRTATARSTTENTEGTEEGIGEQIWDALKASRKAPRWHRTEWALSLGFSSYTRFFRACLICFGKTPHQIEMEMIEEMLSENRKGNGNCGHEDREEEQKGHEGRKEDAGLVKRE